MQRLLLFSLLLATVFCLVACSTSPETATTMEDKGLTAADILGNPNYLAISYGGYRHTSRDTQPTLEELREDMLLLSAMGVKMLRTYNVQLAQAKNLLAVIAEMKAADPDFE
ncbi:MAG: glycosyl hydrolase family 17, partial [Bacteroidota bacterium]